MSDVKFPPTPLSRPGIGSVGKTGTWRVYRPVIDQEKCVKCLLCWLYCPDAAVKRGDDDSVEIDYDFCKGCGICAHECPVNAIEMKAER